MLRMVLVLPCLIGAAGCAADGSGDPFVGAPAPSGESLLDRLGVREYLLLEAPSLIGLAAFDGAGAPLPCLQPDVVSGRVVLRSSGGLLLVEDLELRLSDLEVEAGVLYDDPVRFTAIRLQLGTQIVLEPAGSESGRSAHGSGRADLIMDWALVDGDGDVLPLATQKLRDVDFEVGAALSEGGTVAASVAAAVDGPLWNIAGRIELADLALAVHARSGAAAD